MVGPTEQMTEHSISESTTDPAPEPSSARRLLVAGVLALVVFAAVGAYIWARHSGKSKNATVSTRPLVPGVKAEIVSVARLRAIAAAGGRSIYWAGPRPGTRLEYTQKTDGTTYVRYLTGSAKAGSPGASYVVVATYSEPNAYTQVKRTAEQQHLFVAQLPHGVLAVTRPNRPQNIYVVYSGQPYQIEVYTPKTAETRGIVFAGQIQRVH
jgi:hypothetical protein